LVVCKPEPPLRASRPSESCLNETSGFIFSIWV
jgi:hypothetical protein